MTNNDPDNKDDTPLEKVEQPAPAAPAPDANPLAAGAQKDPPASSDNPDNAPAPDEDCSKDYEPVIRLTEVETKTGEEDEEALFTIRARLFRFSKETNEWKERGTGNVRILKHQKSEKIRLLMRREKTLKICLNHYVNPTVALTENVGSDRSWVWAGVDYADGERDEAMLAIRFRDSDNANKFKEEYDKARDHMRALKEGKASDAADKDQPKPEEQEA